MSRSNSLLGLLLISSLILTAGSHAVGAAPPSLPPAAGHTAPGVPVTPVTITAVSPSDSAILAIAAGQPYDLTIFPTTSAVVFSFQTLIATRTGLGLPGVNAIPSQPRVPDISWDGFNDLTTSHWFMVDDLLPGTTYHYAIYITDTQTPVVTGTFTTLGQE
jgi:hypothetical protein